MPKRLLQQRRGRGSPMFTYPSHKAKLTSQYRTYDDKEKSSVVKGIIIDLIHQRGRNAPLAKIRYETGEFVYINASEGLFVGQEIESGINAVLKAGNTLPLSKIPEGTVISNIELVPGDGGKLVRGAGNKATVVGKDKNLIMVMLPSRKVKKINPKARATIGVIAGGGVREKPLLKAGKTHHKMKNKAKIWPIVAGTTMNPIDHPFGGGGRRTKIRKTVSRHAPPGRKVGSVAARRMGRKKRK